MYVTVVGMLMEVREEQLKKAPILMALNDVGIKAERRDVHLLKTLWSIVVTEVGM